MKLSPSHIILSPLFTEKSENVRKRNTTYVFIVNRLATKKQIEAAMEKVFNVKVDKVRTASTKPKKKRRGVHSGYTSQYKKAYISLKKGSVISGFEAV